MNSMKPILEIRHNRFIYLVLSPIPLAFSGLFFWVLFLNDEPLFGDDIMGTVIFGFFIPVGIFLSYHWFSRFLKDTPIFSVFEEGFESNTNGVSSGLIKFGDIKKVEEQLVREGRGQSAALAIYFKNPEKYEQQQPAVVRMLRSAAKFTGAHHAQRLSSTTEEDMPVLIPISTLGARYPQVKKIIEDKISQYN
jgi:hypothetical protein